MVKKNYINTFVPYVLAFLAVIILSLVVVIVVFFTTKKSDNHHHFLPFQVNLPQQPVKKLVPEFRGPPLKSYKPGHVQQIGVLLGPNESVLPLYGRESRKHRDRYNYYTTTGGENLYPIPITYKNRDCMEDVGCNELYDNEKVSVLGKTGVYTVNIYKNKNLF